jgi:lipopolysaccharide export system permease protein
MSLIARLDRAILRETVGPMLAVLALALAMLVANRILKILPWLFEVQVPFGDVMRLFLWLVPGFLLYAMPVAAWIGWIVGYGRLGVDGELTALASLAVPPGRVLRGAWATGLVFALLAVAVAQWGAGQGRLRFQRELADLAQSAALRALRPGSTVELPGDMILAVPQAPSGESPLWIVRDRDMVMGAASARPAADGRTLELADGMAWTRGSTEPTAMSFALGRVEILQPVPGKSRIGSREMSLTQLLARPADDRGARTELHQLLALAGGLALAPLAAYLMAPRRSRSGRSTAMLTALGGLLVYYGLFTVGKQMALQGRLPVGVGLWLANSILLAGGGLAWWRRSDRPGLP